MAKARNVLINNKKGVTGITHFSPRELVQKKDARISGSIRGDYVYDFGLSESEKEFVVSSLIALYHSEVSRLRAGRYDNTTPYLQVESTVKDILVARGFPSRFAEILKETVVKNAWSLNEGSKTEPILASFGLLNEFLAQDEIETVGEFFDKHWDSILPEAYKLKFSIYPHSTDLLEDLKRGSLLLIRQSNRKSERAILEGLTRSEVSYVLTNHKTASFYGVSNKDAPSLLRNAILEMRGKGETSETVQSVINHFYRIYAQKLVSMRLESSLVPKAIWASFGDFVGNASYTLTKEALKETPSIIYANRIKRYLEVVEKFIDQLTERELFMALSMCVNNRLIARTGTLNDTVTFLEKLIEKYKDDEETLFEAIRVMAQGAGYYKKAMPTMTQWNKALKDGSFESIIDMELFYTIISGDEKPRSAGDHLKAFRRAFKGNDS